MFSPSLFDSYFLGGFECSTHRRRYGRRLDLLALTGHDRAAAQDYRRMVRHGIRADELRRQQAIFDGLFRNQGRPIDMADTVMSDAVRRTASS